MLPDAELEEFASLTDAERIAEGWSHWLVWHDYNQAWATVWRRGAVEIVEIHDGSPLFEVIDP